MISLYENGINGILADEMVTIYVFPDLNIGYLNLHMSTGNNYNFLRVSRVWAKHYRQFLC